LQSEDYEDQEIKDGLTLVCVSQNSLVRVELSKTD